MVIVRYAKAEPFHGDIVQITDSQIFVYWTICAELLVLIVQAQRPVHHDSLPRFHHPADGAVYQRIFVPRQVKALRKHQQRAFVHLLFRQILHE